ncbi:MAG: hypothetical protein AB1439_08330 [candidate division FCPU426 bacterium]
MNDSSNARRDVWLRLAWGAAFAVAAGIQLSRFLLWNPLDLVRCGLLTDDAFFYSVLAKQFLQHGILTLDGEMPTNGVQPLWMLLQILLQRSFPGADSLKLLAVLSWGCYVVFAFLAGWFIGGKKGSLPAQAALAAVLAAYILNPGFQSIAVKGLEVPLALGAVMLTLLSLSRLEGEAVRRLSPLRAGGLGVLAAVCFFCRTDLFWVGLVVGLWLAWKAPRASALVFGAVLTLAVAPYLTANILTQGSVMPISGRVKLHYLNAFYPTWAGYFRSDEWQGWFHAFAAPLPWLERASTAVKAGVTLAVAAGACWWIWKRREVTAGFRVFSLAIILHALYMHVFYRELRVYTAYYFLPEILWVLVTAGSALWAWLDSNRNRAAGKVRLWAAAAVCAALSGAVIWNASGRRVEPLPYWVERLNLARDIERIVPASEPVGAFWPGCFAQFSQRRVIPLDGVAGSDQYFRQFVQTGRELDYLTAKNGRYLALYLPEEPTRLMAEKPLVLENWSHLGLQRLRDFQGTWEVAAFRPLNDQGAGWYLFKLSPANPVE